MMRECLFSAIGKKVRDLFEKDYYFGPKLSFSTEHTKTHILVRHGLHTVNFQAKPKNENVGIIFNVDSEAAGLTVTTDCHEPILPYTRVSSELNIYDFTKSKLKTQFFKGNWAVEVSASGKSPTLNVSGIYKFLETILGIEATIDRTSRVFPTLNFGYSVVRPSTIVSMLLLDKGDLLKASYIRYIDEKTKAVVMEVTRRFSTDERLINMGFLYKRDSFLIKAKISSNGEFRTLLRHQLNPHNYVTFCTEYNLMSLARCPRFGLMLTVKLD